MTGRLRNAPGIHFGGVRHRWVDSHGGFTAKTTRPSVGAVGFRHHLSALTNRLPFQLNHTLGLLYVPCRSPSRQRQQERAARRRPLLGRKGTQFDQALCQFMVELWVVWPRPQWRFPVAHAMLQHRADVSETEHGMRQKPQGAGPCHLFVCGSRKVPTASHVHFTGRKRTQVPRNISGRGVEHFFSGTNQSTEVNSACFTMPGDGHRLAGTRCTKKISTCDAVTSCKVGALGCSHSSVVNTGKEVKGVVRRRRRSLRGRTTLQRCRKEDGRRLHRHCQSGRRSRLGGGCAPWFLTTRHTERSRVRFVLAGRTHARRGACGIV